MNKIIQTIIFTLLISSCMSTEKANSFKNVSNHLDDKNFMVPVLTIVKNKYSKLSNLHFNHSVGGLPIKEETEVQLKYDDKYLEVRFVCKDNPRMDQNYFTEDNSTMYTQEVFEIFISNGDKSLEDYIEIQLNPNNALYLSEIKNGYKSDHKFINKSINTKTSGVIHSVIKDKKNNTWSGYLKIPIKLIQYPNPVSSNVYRLNFYRIISNEDQKDKNWSNNSDNSTYACWSSTMAKRPQFHVPEYFGFLIFD